MQAGAMRNPEPDYDDIDEGASAPTGPEDLTAYAVTVHEAFTHIRKIAADTAQKHATTDPATAELYREWVNNLEDAQKVWVDLKGPGSPDKTTMLERAIDATVITEANAPHGDPNAHGGLVMQWLTILKKEDPGALRRKPRTTEQFARRIALELLMPDNLDRKELAAMDRLNTIAAEIVFVANDTTYPNLATGIRCIGHMALSDLNAIQASASAAVVSSLVLACMPKEKAVRPPRPPALYRPQAPRAPRPGLGLDSGARTAPPRAPKQPKVRFRTEDLHARSKSGRVSVMSGREDYDDDNESVLNRAGVAIIEGLAAVDASVDAFQAFQRRFVQTQTKFRRPDGAVDWANLLISLKGSR